MALYNITSKQEFNDKVLNNDKLVLVDFWASWCSPCVAMAPHLEAAASELDSTVDVVKLRIDDSPEYYENMTLAQEYGVQSIPNMPIFKNGKEVERLIGLMPKPELTKILNDLA